MQNNCYTPKQHNYITDSLTEDKLMLHKYLNNPSLPIILLIYSLLALLAFKPEL